jgi:sugar/nucleoside kinase (ribokinase family)
VSQTLVVGSVALDSIRTSHAEVKEALGGSASYGAVAASFFSPVSLVAIVGTDFDRAHLDMFRGRGIDLAGLEIAEGETFRWHGWYERNMNIRHTNTTLLNVFANFTPKLAPEQRRIPYVFLANIHPELQLSVLEQVEKPRLVVMDTMNFWIEGSKAALEKVIRRVDVFLLSETEAMQYAETDNLIEAGRALVALGPRCVIIKKGEHGALLFFRDRMAISPAHPMQGVFDPTGAGDTFAGAFIGYMALLDDPTDENMLRAAHVGSVMASFVIEDFSLNRLLRATDAEIAERSASLDRMVSVPTMDRSTLRDRQGRAAGTRVA